MILSLRLFGHNGFAHGPPAPKRSGRFTRLAASMLMTVVVAGASAAPARAVGSSEMEAGRAPALVFPAFGWTVSEGMVQAMGLPTAAQRPAPVRLAQAEPPVGDTLSSILSDFPIGLEALGLEDFGGLDLSELDGLCAPSPFFLAFVVNEDMSAVCSAAERLVAVAGGIDGPTGAIPGALGRGFFGGLTGGPSPFQAAFSALGGPAGVINKFKYKSSSFGANQGPSPASFRRRDGTNTVINQTVIVVPAGDAGAGLIGLLTAGTILVFIRRSRRA